MSKIKIPDFAQILIALLLGVIWGSIAFGNAPLIEFTKAYIKPFGDIFINSLKMIAIPLVLASLITGIANLKDISQLSALGGKTISLYLMTTVIAICIGLTLVNIIQPGNTISQETRELLLESYKDDATSKAKSGENIQNSSPLAPLVNVVPTNLVASFSENKRMLQVVFFALIFGIGMLKIESKKRNTLFLFFDGLNDIMLFIISLIMKIAPLGVFALISTQISTVPSTDLLLALMYYFLTVIMGLLCLYVSYIGLVSILTKRNIAEYIRAILPAQLIAFSTSSSSATLPITMKRAEEHLRISPKTSGFVLPLGATINMDGTSLYQAVAAVFIAQVYGIELTVIAQLGIIITALMSSIGAAGVPGAGMVLLTIILSQQGIPVEGLALIIAPDRILDMIRTAINVSGDLTVATLVDEPKATL